MDTNEYYNNICQKFINNTKINPENGKRLIFGKTNYNNYIKLCQKYGYIISDDENDDYENDDYENNDYENNDYENNDYENNDYENDDNDDYENITFTKIKDVNIKILLELDDYELNKICQANKYINTLCNDDYFWKFKLDQLVGMTLFPIDLRNKGKEIYTNFKNFLDKQKIIEFPYDEYSDLLSKLEQDKFDYLSNWATKNNYPSVLNLLIQLKHFPHLEYINLAALKGNIEVLNVLGNYIKKLSPSNNPVMLKYLSKDIFPNVKGANLANLNKQYEVLDLLKEFNIHPDYNYDDLVQYADDMYFKFRDDELLLAVKNFNIYPPTKNEIKNNMRLLPRHLVKKPNSIPKPNNITNKKS
jgi:hypothetical protein